MSAFSYNDELLILRKPRSRVFFPKILMSAFAGLVSFLCPNFICQMTGVYNWAFFEVVWLLIDKNLTKKLWISPFINGVLSIGSFRFTTRLKINYVVWQFKFIKLLIYCLFIIFILYLVFTAISSWFDEIKETIDEIQNWDGERQ